MQDTPGPNPTANNLKYGFDEIAWHRDDINERAAWWRIGEVIEAGWLGQWVGGNADFGWEVYDSGSGVLAIRSTGSDGTPMFFGRTRPNEARPVVGVDRAGRVLEIPSGAELYDEEGAPVVASNDGVWRTLIAAFDTRSREPGTLSLTGGSLTITGVGTQFTRYRDSSATAGQPTLLRIDALDTGSGNEGTYEIDTIVSDTELTVTVAPPVTETDVNYRVKGRYNSGEPADPDIHLNPVVSWTLVSRTTTRPTTALIAYDVKRSGGVVTLIDRRRANVFRRSDGRMRACALLPSHMYWTNLDSGGGSGDSTAVFAGNYAISQATGAGTEHEVVGISMAPCAVGSELAGAAADTPVGIMLATLWSNGTTRAIQIKHFTPSHLGSLPNGIPGTWDDPDNGSAVNVITGATGTKDVALLALPANSGLTHVCFYVLSTGVLARKTSTDNGATWSSETTIWTPTSSHTISRVSACLTRMNKIVVCCTLSAGNRVRYIYSTDLATSWDTNTDAGYSSSAASTAAVDVSVCETDDGNLWTAVSINAAGAIRLFRGQDEGNPLPDSAEQTAAWVVGLDHTSTTLLASSLEAIPMPGGTIAILFGHEDTNGAVCYVQVGRKNVLTQQLLVAAAISSVDTKTAVQVTAGVGPGGHLLVGWGNHYREAGGTTYGCQTRVIAAVPLEVPRALSPWLGGS